MDKEDNIYVYSKNASNNYELLKINLQGMLLWNFPVRYPLYLYLSAVIDGYNNIYFKSGDSLVSVTENGIFRWSKKTIGSYTVPAIMKNNIIITDSIRSIIAFDTAGNTVWNTSLPSLYIEPYFALDDENNIYFNYMLSQVGIGVCSIDKNGYIRWNLENPVVGDVLPGLALSPLGRIFDTPKRPRVVFCIK